MHSYIKLPLLVKVIPIIQDGELLCYQVSSVSRGIRYITIEEFDQKYIKSASWRETMYTEKGGEEVTALPLPGDGYIYIEGQTIPFFRGDYLIDGKYVIGKESFKRLYVEKRKINGNYNQESIPF